ncbi:MAG: thioredoxin family protein [Melioribacter sp.]|nr:thioredoxin family protein [Melioribacter sp.]
MKKIILIFIVLLTAQLKAQDKKENIVLFYFGATSCGPCNETVTINNIKKIKNEFSKVYQEYNIKYVMVCLDRDIKEGLEFIGKYGYWDEISIGSHYNNELVMSYLDKTKIPGVPHIIIFHDEYEKPSTPVIKTRQALVDLVGSGQIDDWVKNKYSLK